MSQSERMSPVDAAWLRMDRPTNMMVINSAMLFDERLNEERLHDREEVTIGLLVHASLVPDPQAIMRHTEQEFAALARLKTVKGTGPARPAQGIKGARS